MTNKTKNIVLIFGFFVLLLVSYKLAFSKTISYKKEYTQLKQQEVLFSNIPQQLSLLKQKQKYYDSILSSYKLNEGSLQNNLLTTLNRYADANNLKVIDFLEPHVFIDDDLTVKTYQLTIEGDYNAILNLIYNFEQQTKFGEIINLHFEKKKNYKTGEYFLQTHMLLKSFN